MAEIRRTLVALGYRVSGKTRLLEAFSNGRYQSADTPVPRDKGKLLSADVDVDGKHLAGSIASLKELNPDVILLCFNVDDPSSIHFLKSDVVRQVGRVCSDKPILFVACKKDVRTDPSELERLRRIDKRLIDPSEGLITSQMFGARDYLECSAKTGEGVREALQCASRIALAQGGESNR